MKSLRNLSSQERAVITALLQGKPETVHFIDALDDFAVKPLADGGMGSLSFVPKGIENVSRSFGHQLSLGEFTDSDGVPVSVAVNVDSQGQLYELDVWKVNFSPLLAWPASAVVKIVE